MSQHDEPSTWGDGSRSRVALAAGETLADYAFRVTAERDRAIALLRECRSFVAAFPGTTTSTLLARLDEVLR